MARPEMVDAPHITTLKGPVPLSRATPEVLKAEIATFAESPIVRALLEALGGGLLVLNDHRQIVAANLKPLVATPERAALSALGLRPGEALGCIHASERPGGCGGSEACRACGALKTILGCQIAQAPIDGECLVTAANGEIHSLELRLRAAPVVVGDRRFTVLAIRDASDEKRRSVLEQVFFHDLLNLLTPLSNWSQMLSTLPEHRLRSAGEKVARLVKRLAGEIHGQRALLSAEHGTLELALSSLRATEVMRELSVAFGAHPLARDRALLFEDAPVLEIETDKALLLRALTNMVTNALEATPPEGRVRVWCEASTGEPWACTFHVHNDAVMPPEVAVHVFQRSFSTKAKRGRGLGTYAMRLLGERYLGGEVRFASRLGEGTTFSLRLPTRSGSPERKEIGSCF
jgi:signal transduction histidine kinase